MGDWLSYLRLTARARTGVSGNVLISGAVVAWAAAGTFLWLSITLFVWIAFRFTWNDWVFAGLMLSALYGLVTAGAAGLTILVRNYAQQKAEAALAARKASMLDPSLLGVGLEIGRAIGWSRLVSLAGVALLASGLAKEWFSRGEEPPPEEEN